MTDFVAFAETLRCGLGVPHAVVRRVDSTNRLARTLIAADGVTRDPWPPCWLVAFEQQAGRGRLGRRWTSEPGLGIYATLLAEVTTWSIPRVSLLPLLVGSATAMSLRAPLAGTPGADAVRLKWPNDLVVAGRKLGGILIESVERNERRFAVIGIGVNHGQTEEQLPEPRATSLRMVHGAFDLELPTLADTAVAMCRAVADTLQDPSTPEQILDTYRELIAHRVGDELSWSSHEGPVEGHFVEIDADGAIVLDTASGRRRVSSGDVVQVEKAE